MTREPGSQLASFINSALESGLLTIVDPISWGHREGHLKARVDVEYPDDSGFRVELLQVSVLPQRFSIQLMYKGRTARRYCSQTSHRQPRDCPDDGNVRLSGKHKHRWSDETGDECAYVPEDISGGLIEESFYEFCAECGINFMGVWRDPPGSQLGFEVVG